MQNRGISTEIVQKILDVWQLQSIVENIPEIYLRERDGKYLSTWQAKNLLERKFFPEKYCIDYTPIRAVSRLEKYRDDFAINNLPLVQCFVGVMSPENFFGFIKKISSIFQKNNGSNEEYQDYLSRAFSKNYSYLFSFFTDKYFSHIYSNVDFNFNESRETTGEDTECPDNSLKFAPFCFPLFWLYLAQMLRGNQDNLKLSRILDLQNGLTQTFVDLWAKNQRKEFLIKDWVVDTSFLMKYASLESNPFISLANQIGKFTMHLSTGVLGELEGLKKSSQEEKKMRAIKAARYLKEFEDFVDQNFDGQWIKWYDISEDKQAISGLIDSTYVRELDLSKLSETDIHSVYIATEMIPDSEVALLTMDYNQMLFFNYNRKKQGRNSRQAKSLNKLPLVILQNSSEDGQKKKFEDMLNTYIQYTGFTEVAEFLNYNSICSAFYSRKFAIINELNALFEQSKPSFFLSDLSMVKSHYPDSTSEVLKKYFEGNENSKYLDEKITYSLLSPDLIPEARWPVQAGQYPFLNQYLAVVTAVNSHLSNNKLFQLSNLISVNGPPGTGKTTLLKDYIANFIVEKAKIISNAVDNSKLGTLWEKVECETGDLAGVTYYKLNPELSKKVAIVVSANNNAVENVTRELPDAQSWLNDQNPLTAKTIFSVDANRNFFAVGNKIMEEALSNLKKNSSNYKEKEDEAPLEAEKSDSDDKFNYFLISAVLGRTQNIRTFFECISNFFDKHILSCKNIFNCSDIYEARNSAYEHLRKAVHEFDASIDNIKKIKNQIQKYQEKVYGLPAIEKKIETITRELEVLQSQIDHLKKQLQETRQVQSTLEMELRQAQAELEMFTAELNEKLLERKELSEKWQTKLAVVLGVFGMKKKIKEIKKQLTELDDKIDYLNREIKKAVDLIGTKNKQLTEETYREELIEKQLNQNMADYDSLKNEELALTEKKDRLCLIINNLESELELSNLTSNEKAEKLMPYSLLDSLDDASMQAVKPYSFPKLKQLQEELFINALNLMYAFILYSERRIKHNLQLLMQFKCDVQRKPMALSIDKDFMKSLWGTFFLIFPVVSSTFHSIENMFSEITAPESFETVIVDEAGQAASFMASGIFHRCKNALVVGDPMQLEPVVTAPPELLEWIVFNFVEEGPERMSVFKFISGTQRADNINGVGIDSSVQILADNASVLKGKISFDSDGDALTIGIPLRIHFRCAPTIMEASNRIAYGGIMVHFNPVAQDKGKLHWIDVPENQWVENTTHCCYNEIKATENLIESLLKSGIKPEDIFVISPFRNISEYLKKHRIATRIKDGNIGTVHTFQGKEAKVVIVVMGGQTEGARNWVVQKPNLLNVAITRAKKQFYFVGNFSLWGNKKFISNITNHPKILNVSPLANYLHL